MEKLSLNQRQELLPEGKNYWPCIESNPYFHPSEWWNLAKKWDCFLRKDQTPFDLSSFAQQSPISNLYNKKKQTRKGELLTLV